MWFKNPTSNNSLAGYLKQLTLKPGSSWTSKAQQQQKKSWEFILYQK